jgi:ATP-dependent helicase/nuclease subunit A
MTVEQPNLFDLPSPDLPSSDTSPRPAPPPVDESERAFAKDPRNHVVLEASAGTGKTKVLVDRYVNLIEAGVDPRNILAITFTRKAAAEMRDRVLTTIHERVARADDGANTKALRAQWAIIKDRAADINISTIDAFCFGLLREFPLEADVDPAFEIADETEVPRFRAEAIELTLAACREALVSDERVRLLLAFKGPARLKGALDKLLDSRHVALAAVREYVARQGAGETVEGACRTFVSSLARAMQNLPDRSALLLRGPSLSERYGRLAADLHEVSQGTFPVESPSDVRRLQRAVEWYFLTKGGDPRKRLVDEASKGFEATADKSPHAAAMSALAPDVAAALTALARAVNVILSHGLLRVLELAVGQFDAIMAEHSVLDFPAMLARAVELLGRQEEFARSRLKLQTRYHHLLVDEFQDTSEAQWKLVELLTRAWSEGEGAADAAIPPSIFIVGDRKQSIYRFRYADVTLMDVAAEFIEGLTPGRQVRRAIQQSFRSVPELLGFVNQVATEMRSQESIPERFEYRALDQFPIGMLQPGALRDGEPVLGLAVGTDIESTANAVATEIQRLLASGTPVRDRDGMRPIRPDDIAILFRSRTAHRYYEEALEARRVKTYVYKGLGFFESPEVQDLHALLRYLARPEDNLRAAAFLRSRFIRLSDAALVKLAPGLAASLRSPGVDVAAKGLGELDAALMVRARDSVAGWLDAADRVPPAELVDRILDETAYAYELHGARYAQARENVKKVRSLIRRVQNRGYATFSRLADYFRRLATGEEANAIIAAKGCVQLMTVHSAKGLEFPVVFLVRLQASVRSGEAQITVVPKDEQQLPDVAVSISPPSGKIERARDAEERRRLFYVAMTRARDRLYFSAEVEEGKKAGGTSFERLLPPALQHAIEQGVPAAGHERVTWTAASGASFTFKVCLPDPNPTPLSTDALPATGALDATPLVDTDLPRVAATSATDTRGKTGENDLISPIAPPLAEGASSRQLGTLVHRMFQHRVDPADLAVATAWAETLIRPDDLVGSGDDAATLAEAAAEMYQAMRERADVAQALGAGPCHYEVPFSLRIGIDAPGASDQILRGQIDAVVVPATGPLLVVEFKTGQPAAEHEAQVAVYRRALAAAWPGREVEARLFYF